MRRNSSLLTYWAAFLCIAGILTLGCNGKSNENSNTNTEAVDTLDDEYVETPPVPIDSNEINFVAEKVDGMVRYRTAGGKYGFINDKGDTVIRAKYPTAFDFHDGIAKVKLAGKTGYIDKKGDVVIPIEYERLNNFYEGKAAVYIDGKWGFLDRKNKLILPAIYDSTQAFGEGVCPVLLDSAKYWSYIDVKGKVVIGEDKKFEAAWPFAEGLSHVSQNELWGFIDHKGKVVIPIKYYNAGQFKDGSAPVQIETQWIRIDKKGKCVKNCEIDPNKHTHVDLPDSVIEEASH